MTEPTPSRAKIIEVKLKIERNRRDAIIHERFERHMSAYLKRKISNDKNGNLKQKTR